MILLSIKVDMTGANKKITPGSKWWSRGLL